MDSVNPRERNRGRAGKRQTCCVCAIDPITAHPLSLSASLRVTQTVIFIHICQHLSCKQVLESRNMNRHTYIYTHANTRPIEQLGDVRSCVFSVLITTYNNTSTTCLLPLPSSLSLCILDARMLQLNDHGHECLVSGHLCLLVCRIMCFPGISLHDF